MVSLTQAIIFGMVFASGTLIGYDSGYLNGVLGSPDFIRRYGISDDGGSTWFLTPRTRALFSSMLVVGTVVGACLPSILPDRMGRKGSFLLAATSYAIGASMQASGPSAAVFILGRVLLGLGLGLISVVSPGYLVEASLGSTRGRMVALYLQLLTCGNVLACAISLGTSKLQGSKSWRITVAFQLVLAVLVFLGAAVAPESPVTLMKRKQVEQAKKSLARLRNIDVDSEKTVEAMQGIHDWLAEQESFDSVNITECFRGTNLRRTLIGAGMGFMTIATGITFWFGYGTTFFLAAGVKNPYLVSLILAIVNATFTAPSVYLIERIGRRNSMFYGGLIMGAAQLLTAVIHTCIPTSTTSNNMLVAGSVLFIAAYAATWGAVGWVTMTEPFSARLRTQSTSVTLIVYWISTWAVGFSTPYLVDPTAANLGINVAYLWVGMVVLSAVWGFLCVPELAGLSITEVDMLFEQKVAAWRSKSWIKQLRTMHGTAVETTEMDVGLVHQVPKGEAKKSPPSC